MIQVAIAVHLGQGDQPLRLHLAPWMVYFMENPIGLGLAATPHDFGNRNGVLECQQRADVGCPRRFLLTFFGEIQLLGLPKRFSLFEFCEKKKRGKSEGRLLFLTSL
jgi:hypothetical protein